MKIIGIDMTQSNKPCSLVVLNSSRKITNVKESKDDNKIISFCSGADLVAIDSPLFFPAGLCCLEEDCECQPISDKKGRECERRLSQMCIPSYYTTKKTIIKEMIYRSIRIAAGISQKGTQVIEIYPHASSKILFGKLPKITTQEGFETLIEKMENMVNGIEKIKTHDQADALLGAYTGWLKTQGQLDAIGNQDEGFLWIPKVEGTVP
jgi:predicted nuclease with RNAse H fold